MRLPRSVSGGSLAKSLQKFGYRATRQTGSHIRLTCNVPNQHHITIPNHDPIRAGILSDVASHLKMPKESLVK